MALVPSTPRAPFWIPSCSLDQSFGELRAGGRCGVAASARTHRRRRARRAEALAIVPLVLPARPRLALASYAPLQQPAPEPFHGRPSSLCPTTCHAWAHLRHRRRWARPARCRQAARSRPRRRRRPSPERPPSLSRLLPRAAAPSLSASGMPPYGPTSRRQARRRPRPVARQRRQQQHRRRRLPAAPRLHPLSASLGLPSRPRSSRFRPKLAPSRQQVRSLLRQPWH